MILSRNSFAVLKTGMASPTIALVPPTASIGGGQDGRELNERVVEGQGLQTRSSSSCGGNGRNSEAHSGQSPARLGGDGGPVNSACMPHPAGPK